MARRLLVNVLVRIQSLLPLLAACSHHTTPPQDPKAAAATAAEKQEAALEAERPPEPYETYAQAAYAAKDRCGQGPYEVTATALHAKYGEGIAVYACGPHGIRGNVRVTMTAPREASQTVEQRFGDTWDESTACKGSRAVPAGDGSGSASGGASTGGHAATSGAPASAATASAKPRALATVEVPGDCQVRTAIWSTDAQMKASVEPPVSAGARYAIEIWSDEPIDFDQLALVVKQTAAAHDMTLERWNQYLAASAAWWARYQAFSDGEVKAGRAHYVTDDDSKPKSPPPPAPRAETKPPKPSAHARWIPGYWHYEGTEFHWIAGEWNVPDEDVAKDLTTHAPAPPPAAPPATEPAAPADPAPSTTAVWVPGYWAWNAGSYVWIDGTWRIPPKSGGTYRAARWRLVGRGAVFVPGGWR